MASSLSWPSISFTTRRWLSRVGGGYGRPIRSPSVARPGRFVLDSDRHRTKTKEETNFGANGPPVVEEHFQGAPHGNPSANEKALPEHLGEPIVAKVASDGVANGGRRAEEREPDHQADVTSPKQLAKFPPRTSHSFPKVLVNRVAKRPRFVRSPSAPLEVDQQGQGCVTRQIAGPFDNEFLGTRIEVALAERRGIDGVGELPRRT